MNKKTKTYAQFLLYAFLVYCTLIVGSSWDEFYNMTRGFERLKYLFSLGSYESYFFHSMDEQFYPAFYDTLASFLTKMFPKKYELQIWHLSNSIFSVLSLIGIYKISCIFFNKQAATIIFVLCFFNPIFFGHMPINPKDTVIAFSNIWSTYIIIRYLQGQHLNSKRKRYILLAGLTIGLGTGVRLPFLATLIPLFLFVIIDIFMSKKITNSKFSIYKFVKDILIVLIIAYVITVFAWPHVHGNIFLEPFKLLIEVIKGIQTENSFGVSWILFNGNFYETDKLPYHYILTNFLYKTPEYILICYIAFFYIIITNREFFSSKFKFFWYKILLIIFIFLFPIIYFIILPYRVYDGLRLFLYLIPYFNIIPGLVIYYFLNNSEILVNRAFLLILGCFSLYFLFTFFSLTPYQYTYLNKLNGDFSNSDKKFENDYWAVSINELVKQISNNKNLLNNSDLRLAFCGAPDDNVKFYLKKIENFKFQQVNWFNEEYDYIIMTNRVSYSKNFAEKNDEEKLNSVGTCFDMFKGTDIITVKRNGLILSTLRSKN